MRTAAATVVLLTVLAGCGSSSPGAGPTSLPSSAPTEASPTASPTGLRGYLAAADLPQGNRYGLWVRGEPTNGLGDPPYFCLREALPVSGTMHRVYSSDKDAEVREFVVHPADAALETEVRDAIAGCAARYRRVYPQDKASGQDFPADASGPAVSGVFFAPKDSEYGLQLYAVWRSGELLTVLVLAQGGTAAEAPVEAFRAAAAKLG